MGRLAEVGRSATDEADLSFCLTAQKEIGWQQSNKKLGGMNSMLIGQVYSPKMVVKEVDGKEKVSFTFSLGQPRAMKANGSESMVFTRCVVYNAALAKVLNEHFGKEEHHGKPIAVYGRWHEYEVWADPSFPQHAKYCTEVTLTKEQLEAAGLRFAEGSAEEITLLLPTKRIVRDFVVSGFEFIGYPGTTTTEKKMTKEKPSFVIKPKETATTETVTPEPTPAVDDVADDIHVVLEDELPL